MSSYIKQTTQNDTPIIVTTQKQEPVVVISLKEWDALNQRCLGKEQYEASKMFLASNKSLHFLSKEPDLYEQY